MAPAAAGRNTIKSVQRMGERQKMGFSPYLPHVLYSLALVSISINLVSRKKIVEDERARVAAQTSILESIKQQLQSHAPLSVDELERLKKLARSSASGGDEEAEKEKEKEKVSWGDVFTGKGPAGRDAELSKWDKQDLETLRKELSK